MKKYPLSSMFGAGVSRMGNNSFGAKHREHSGLHRWRSFFAPLCIGILILFGILVAEVRAFGVNPVILKLEIRRGRSMTATLNLYSTFERDERVIMYLTRYFIKQDGTIDFTPLDEGKEVVEGEKEPEVTLFKEEITLAPGDSINFNLRIDVPIEATHNEYVYALMFESADNTSVPIEENRTRVQLTQRVAVPVIIYVPGRRNYFRAAVLDIKQELKEDYPYLITTVENTGNRYIDVSGAIKLLGTDGKIIHALPLIPKSPGDRAVSGVTTILPGGKRDFHTRIDYPLKAGSYEAEAVLYIAQNRRSRPSFTKEFVLEKDLSEVAVASFDPIIVEPAVVRAEIPEGGSQIFNCKIINRYIDKLTMRLAAEDEQAVQVSRLPIRLDVGEFRQLSFRLHNTGKALIETAIVVKFDGIESETRIPITIVTP